MIFKPICALDCPLYAIAVLDDGSVVVAGGGGAAKTGVPNKIDFVTFKRRISVDRPAELIPYDVETVPGTSTNISAVMNMKLCSSFFVAENASCVSNFLTLQDEEVIEYSATLKKNGSEVECKELYRVQLGEDAPSALACGPPGASWCVALGMNNSGKIHVVDRGSFARQHEPKPIISIEIERTDARVFCLAFSPVVEAKQTGSDFEKSWQPPTFLAAIHDRPDGETLRIFRLSVDISHNDLVYSYKSHERILVSHLGITHVLPKKNFRCGSRFKHCEFLNWRRSTQLMTSNKRLLLATTVLPISINAQFYSQLALYCVEVDKPEPTKKASWLITMVNMPQGQVPSCITAHPNQATAILGVGTISGSVLVYHFLPQAQCLNLCYHVAKSHSIFVTNLVFLPSRENPPEPQKTLIKKRTDSKPRWDASSLFYEMVTVSADRTVCWHSGPAFASIRESTRSEHDFFSPKTRQLAANLAFYLTAFVILFAPLIFAIFDRILSF